MTIAFLCQSVPEKAESEARAYTHFLDHDHVHLDTSYAILRALRVSIQRERFGRYKHLVARICHERGV